MLGWIFTSDWPQKTRAIIIIHWCSSFSSFFFSCPQREFGSVQTWKFKLIFFFSLFLSHLQFSLFYFSAFSSVSVSLNKTSGNVIIGDCINHSIYKYRSNGHPIAFSIWIYCIVLSLSLVGEQKKNCSHCIKLWHEN